MDCVFRPGVVSSAPTATSSRDVPSRAAGAPASEHRVRCQERVWNCGVGSYLGGRVDCVFRPGVASSAPIATSSRDAPSRASGAPAYEHRVRCQLGEG